MPSEYLIWIIWVFFLTLYLFCIYKERVCLYINQKYLINQIQCLLAMLTFAIALILREWGEAIAWLILILYSLSKLGSTSKSLKFFQDKTNKNLKIRPQWSRPLVRDIQKAFLSCQTKGELEVIQSIISSMEQTIKKD